MGQLSTLNLFVAHAWRHGTPDDKRFARFIIWNELKGVAIANFLTLAAAGTMFKNYRNSTLLLGKNAIP